MQIIRLIIIFLIIGWSSSKTYSQLVNYEIRIVELMATADLDDLEGQDPAWFFWMKDNGTNGAAVTTWVPSGGFYVEDNQYGQWFSGTPNEGAALPFTWQVVTSSNATQIQTEAEGNENDCPDELGYEDECYCVFSICANGDDNFDMRAPAGNIDFMLDPPCQWNQYTISNDDYFARVEVYWTFTTLDPGQIDGEQYVCLGGDPAEFGSVAGGDAALSSWVTYQWQESVGCTGAFVDILGATNDTYDPPLGILQNSCYRRKVLTACDEAVSNEIIVGIEVPSAPATSISANPASLCGSGPVNLSVNGGTLGSNADWYWYDNDPNSTGNLLGVGDPFVINMTNTSTFYVRAEGSCSQTASVSKTVVVETPSNPPTALTPSNSSICRGDLVNLTASGGVLGTNALYAWYDVDPLIGSPLPIFTSSAPVFNGVSPVNTTTYYVRIEGCDTTNFAFATITVNEPSDDPNGINASNTTVCPNNLVSLTVNGGNLGTGADWYWYESGCGAGTPIGTGITINVNPSVTTNYFVRAEGTCGNSNCANVSIVVNDDSDAPATIVATSSLVCPGDVTVLSVVGGSIGTAADWYWYSAACGGLLVGNGSTISVNPTATTDYFVRAEGACNTTSCANTTISVKSSSTQATGITASANNICPNTPITLTVNGGTLGTGATWEWYTSSCGGIYLGSGNTLNVIPTTTTTYYARAEGDCFTTGCVNTTVIVSPTSVLPTSITVSNPNVCPGGSTDLTVVGGALVPGDNWTWYETGCGAGTAIGTGNTINVSPTGPTEYFVRGEGTCGATNCASVTVNTSENSITPDAIVATSTALCQGQSTVLSVSGGMLGTGAAWYWYSGSCGTGPIGSGNSISVSPSATTTYYVRGEGTCGNSACANITITIGAGVPDPTGASFSANNICPGESTTLSVNGPTLPAGYSWVWYTSACGALPVGAGDQITVSPNATETYYVRAVGTCGETNCASVTVTVQVGDIAPTGVTASNNGFCVGEQTTLTVQGGSLVAGSDWVWYENSCGGTSVGTGSSVTVSPDNSATYFVRAEGGTCGATSCASIFISVDEVIVHCNPFDTICGIGPPFALQGGEPDGGFYAVNGVNTDVFSPVDVGVGAHIITYTYTSPQNGCTASVDKSIVVKETDLEVEIKVDEFPCSQGGVTLNPVVTNAQGFINYLWSDGSYDPKITFAEEGTYSVLIEDGQECYATSNEIVVTSESLCIEIPNTFTPNGDGKNDTWNLYFDEYDNAELIVLSKWGAKVFITTSREVHWDGKSNDGAELPAGVYYYVLKLNDGEKEQNGTITLLR